MFGLVVADKSGCACLNLSDESVEKQKKGKGRKARAEESGRGGKRD